MFRLPLRWHHDAVPFAVGASHEKHKWLFTPMRFVKRQFQVGISLVHQKICGFMSETADEEGDMKITGISVYKTGLSKARRVRDYLVDNRIAVVAEDTWGGEITSTTLSHFAASTPAEYLQNSTDLMNYVTRSTGIGGAYAKDGLLFAPDSPGLGVKPDFESFGDPVAQWRL